MDTRWNSNGFGRNGGAREREETSVKGFETKSPTVDSPFDRVND